MLSSMMTSVNIMYKNAKEWYSVAVFAALAQTLRTYCGNGDSFLVLGGVNTSFFSFISKRSFDGCTVSMW